MQRHYSRKKKQTTIEKAERKLKREFIEHFDRLSYNDKLDIMQIICDKLKKDNSAANS